MTDTLTEAVATLRRIEAVLAADRPDPLAEVEDQLPDGLMFKSLGTGEVRTRNQYLTGLAKTRIVAPELAPELAVRYGSDWPPLSEAPPTVLLGWRFEDLPPRGWQGNASRSQFGWPDEQPTGSPIFPKALHVADNTVSSPTTAEDHTRIHKVAVLADAADAPPTPDGTQALVVAAMSCRRVASQLATWSPNRRADQTRRFTNEAAWLLGHADACVAALRSSMAWVADFDANHPTAAPRPAFPTVPAEMRGSVEITNHNNRK